jgi:DNA-binding transcriptional LysR family regulator
LIVRENDAAYGAWHFRRGKSTETVKVDNVLSSNDGNAVLRWTLDGHGIAIRSAWEIAPYLARGELIPLLGDWKLPNADIYATYLERSEVSSAKVRAFLDFTAKYLATS